MEILVTIPDTFTEHLQPEEPTTKHQLQRLLLEEAVISLRLWRTAPPPPSTWMMRWCKTSLPATRHTDAKLPKLGHCDA
jgi:hypothetical protein